jgi:hypothetical protein
MSLLTEEEAAMKWCVQSGSDHCMGSDCMAWRWGQMRNPDWKPDHPGMMSYGQSHPDDRAPTHISDTEHGYCGLAGRT